MSTISTRSLSAVSVVLSALLALTACSQEPAPQPTVSNSQGASDNFDQALMDWQIDYAACMREHGIDMPDPEVAGAVGGFNPGEVDTAAFDAANTTCLDTVGEPPVASGGPATGVRQEQLKLVECLRENGIDIDDPKPGEGIGMPEINDEVARACGLAGGTDGETE